MTVLSGLLVLAAPLALDGSLVAETGPEFDSNANRALPTDAVASPLWRLQLGGRLRHSTARHRLRLSLDVGGKLFALPAARGQDVGVLALSFEDGGPLGPLRLSTFGSYFDAYQRGSGDEARDLRLGALGLRLAGARAASTSGTSGAFTGVEGAVDVLGEAFQYKPDDRYTYATPSLQPRLTLRWHRGDPELGQDLDLTLSARLDHRRYFLDERDLTRGDLFAQAGATFGFSGPVVVQAGYLYQNNRSTLYQESYQRHVVLAKLAFRLPHDFYVTLKGQLNLFFNNLFTSGNQPPPSSLEDDNRSLALLDIERPLPRGFALLLRYAAYFSVRGAELPYQRHTLALTVSYRLRRARGD